MTHFNMTIHLDALFLSRRAIAVYPPCAGPFLRLPKNLRGTCPDLDKFERDEHEEAAIRINPHTVCRRVRNND